MGLFGRSKKKEVPAVAPIPKLVVKVFSWRDYNCEGLYEVVVSQLGVEIVMHGKFRPGNANHDTAYAKAIDCQQRCIDEIVQLSPLALKWKEWLEGHTMQKFLMQ